MDLQLATEYPPHPYFMQVIQHCSKAAETYIKIWKHRSKKNTLSIYKKDIRNEFFVSQTKFRNDLLALVREGLVSIDESPLMLTIELVDFDPEYDQYGNPLDS